MPTEFLSPCANELTPDQRPERIAAILARAVRDTLGLSADIPIDEGQLLDRPVWAIDRLIDRCRISVSWLRYSAAVAAILSERKARGQLAVQDQARLSIQARV